MARYRLQEAEFVIPDNWTDQTLNIFKLPAVGEAKEASFLISRDVTPLRLAITIGSNGCIVGVNTGGRVQ